MAHWIVLGLVVVATATAAGFLIRFFVRRARAQRANAEALAIRTPNGIESAMFVRLARASAFAR